MVAANAGVNPQTGNAPTTDTTSGSATAGRGRPSSSLAGALGTPPGNDNTAAPASAAAQSDSPATNSADQAQSGSAANAPGTDNSASQQAQTNTDPMAPAPILGSLASLQTVPRSEMEGGTSPGAGTASDAAGSAGETKADIAGLPNFGFAVAAGAATQATNASAAATTSAASAVPIAGLAVAITARAQAGVNQFDIRLDPPELGRIDVRLGVDRDGQVTSHVTVDRPDTLQLLQSQQPQLERALEQAGLKTADNGLQFSLRDQSFTGQNGGGNTPSYAPTLVVPDNELAAVSARQTYNRFGLGTGIDIRV
jgi:flagellar hook-length control protein FliK